MHDGSDGDADHGTVEERLEYDAEVDGVAQAQVDVEHMQVEQQDGEFGEKDGKRVDDAIGAKGLREGFNERGPEGWEEGDEGGLGGASDGL